MINLNTKAESVSLFEFINELREFEEIKMPLFQRAYGWANKKEIKEKKIERYIKNFLLSENSQFFGTILMYSTATSVREDIKTLYLADGQHRLVVINVLLFVLKNIIKSSMLSKTDLEKNEIFIGELFNLYYTQENLISKKVSDSLGINMETQDESNLNQEVSGEENSISITADIISKVLKEEMSESKIPTFLTNLRNNLKRIKVCKIQISPQSEEDEKAPQINRAVYEIFVQLNGEAIPLKANEIYEAHIAQLRENKRYTQEIKKVDDLIKKIKEWNISYIIDKKVEFLSKASDYPQDSTITWVLDKQGDSPSEISKAWEGLSDVFTEVFSKNKDINYLIAQKLIRSSKSASLFAFLSKVGRNEDFKNAENQKLLPRILLLLELMPLLKTITKTNFNISRDLHKQKTIKEAAHYLYTHFKMDSITFKQKVIEALSSNTAIGEKQQFRNLAKLLLILPDASLNGIVDHFNQIDVWSYEHILPQAFESMLKKEIALPDQIKSNYEDILKDPETKTAVYRIGNGALLNNKENSTLQNKTPYSKANASETELLAWWAPHKECLLKNKENWNKNIIENRSIEISKKVVDWLVIEELANILDEAHKQDSEPRKKYSYILYHDGKTKEFKKLRDFFKHSLSVLELNRNFEEKLKEEYNKEKNSSAPFVIHNSDTPSEKARYLNFSANSEYRVNLTKNGKDVISWLESFAIKLGVDVAFDQKEIKQ